MHFSDTVMSKVPDQSSAHVKSSELPLATSNDDVIDFDDDFDIAMEELDGI